MPQPPEEKRLKHREIDALEASYGPNDDDDDDEDEDEEEELENNKTSTFRRKTNPAWIG